MLDLGNPKQKLVYSNFLDIIWRSSEFTSRAFQLKSNLPHFCFYTFIRILNLSIIQLFLNRFQDILNIYMYAYITKKH